MKFSLVFSVGLLVGCISGVIQLSFGQVPVMDKDANPLASTQTRGNVTPNMDVPQKGGIAMNGTLTRARDAPYFRISACIGSNGCSECSCGGFVDRECNRICEFYDYRGSRCRRRACVCYRRSDGYYGGGGGGGGYGDSYDDDYMDKEEPE